MSDHDNKDDGSVWTSYSDMFTTMAIIFLVMFVFALLRSGVSTLTALKEKQEKEEFIKGQISKKEIERDKKVMKNLETEIAQMSDFNEIIDSKIKQINNFSEKMNKHKKLVSEALRKQNISHVALMKARKVIRDKELTLTKNRKEIRKLNRKVASVTKQISELQSHNTIALMESAKTESELSSENKRIRSELIAKNKKIEAQLTAEKKTLESKLIAEKKQAVLELTTENDLLKKKIQAEVQSTNSQQKLVQESSKRLEELQKIIEQKTLAGNALNQKISKMEGQIKSQESENRNSKSELSNVKKMVKSLENRLASAEKLSSNLSRKLADRDGQLASAQDALNSMKGASAGQSKQLADSQRHNKSLEAKLRKALGENTKLRGKVKSLASSESQLKGSLGEMKSQLGEATKKNKRVARGIASVQQNMRSKIGARIAKHLADANLKVKVDPMTGSVTLVMDDNFRFKRNSAILSDNAKSTLQQIIPVYTEALFSDPKIVKYIEGINIVGHASPRFEQEYISPKSANHNKAYNYNMALSTARAKEIVRYIFSNAFGRFQHKANFRTRVSAIGRSFSEPVKRAPASKDNGCGMYDCPSSRRVEIKFTLKENNEIWTKLQRLN